jgi:hypothetical protein
VGDPGFHRGIEAFLTMKDGIHLLGRHNGINATCKAPHFHRL